MASTVFMFIPFLKQLVVDVDPKEIQRIEKILNDNEILYRIKSSSLRGVFGRHYDSAAYKTIVMPLYIDAQRPTISYVIYVRKRDFERANSLIN